MKVSLIRLSFIPPPVDESGHYLSMIFWHQCQVSALNNQLILYSTGSVNDSQFRGFSHHFQGILGLLFLVMPCVWGMVKGMLPLRATLANRWFGHFSVLCPSIGAGVVRVPDTHTHSFSRLCPIIFFGGGPSGCFGSSVPCKSFIFPSSSTSTFISVARGKCEKSLT